MSEDDVLFGYRLQLVDLAGRIGVAAACRTFGVHRSTYYGWKRKVERDGLGALRPRERRQPRCRTSSRRSSRRGSSPSRSAIPASARAGSRPSCGRERWGGLVVSAQRRLALPAPARPQHPREAARARRRLRGALRAAARPEPERHVEAERPGELVGFDCFFVGRLPGTKGAVWQLTAIDVYSSYAWAELVACPRGNPTGAQTSKLARRVAAELQRPAGGSSACSPTTAASFAARFQQTLASLGARHPSSAPAARRRTERSRRCTRRSSRSAGGPPSPATSTSASRASAATSTATSLLQLRPRPPRPPHPRPHPRRHRLRCPQDGGEVSRTCRHISETVHPRRRSAAGRRSCRSARTRPPPRAS